MKTLLFLLCLFWMGGPFTLIAQHEDLYEISPFAAHETFLFHFNASLAAPLGELKEAVRNEFGNVGIGFSSAILANPFGKKKVSPVFVGVLFEYHTYGVDKIPATDPPLKSTFNIYTVSGIARVLLSRDNTFVPFVDGTLGAQIFNTRTKVDKDLLSTVLNDDQPEVLGTTNDTGLHHSLGMGFYKRKPRSGFADNKISFTLRVMYGFGDDVTYVKRDSIVLTTDGFLTYETATTRTDMLTVQVGVMLY